MYFILDKKNKWAFRPIPKCACTTVKYHIAVSMGIDVPDPKLIHSITLPYRQGPPPEDYFTWAVVRHPLQRLVSAYLNRTDAGRKENGRPPLPRRLPPGDQNGDHASDDHAIKSGLFNTVQSFDDFVKSVTMFGPTGNDPHMRPQWTYLAPEGELLTSPGGLIPFEDMQSILKILGPAKLNVDFSAMEKLNASASYDWKSYFKPDKGKPVSPVEYYMQEYGCSSPDQLVKMGLNIGELARDGRWKDSWKKNNTYHMAVEYYKKDFELFGYDAVI